MRPSLALRAAIPLLLTAAVHAQQLPPRADSRGAMLYETHCITCHTEQMHWRTLRRARDWDTLREQVRRWKDEARLVWTDEDVDAVARHLNDTIYRYPVPEGRAGAGGPQGVAARR